MESSKPRTSPEIIERLRIRYNENNTIGDRQRRGRPELQPCECDNLSCRPILRDRHGRTGAAVLGSSDTKGMETILFSDKCRYCISVAEVRAQTCHKHDMENVSFMIVLWRGTYGVFQHYGVGLNWSEPESRTHISLPEGMEPNPLDFH